MKNIKEKVLKEHKENWIKDVINKGESQIRKELEDYWWLLGAVPKVYDRVTNGILSKPNTDPYKLLELYEEQQEKKEQETLASVGKAIEKCKIISENSYGKDDGTDKILLIKYLIDKEELKQKLGIK